MAEHRDACGLAGVMDFVARVVIATGVIACCADALVENQPRMSSVTTTGPPVAVAMIMPAPPVAPSGTLSASAVVWRGETESVGAAGCVAVALASRSAADFVPPRASTCASTAVTPAIGTPACPGRVNVCGWPGRTVTPVITGLPSPVT